MKRAAPTWWETATAEEMLGRLGQLDREAFEHALHNEAFTEDHVMLLLRDPGVDSELLERVSREPRYFRKGAIRVGLVLHPKLPRVRALELVRHLYWRDMIRVAAQPHVHPQVRVVAEQAVAERLPDLTLGERIAIARLAGRGLLRALRTDPEPRVAEALLRNFRCTEEDVVYMASVAEPQVLAAVARDRKWRVRPAVRSQLVRNRRLPLPIALGLLSELSKGDLAAVSRRAELPKLLRQSAQRLLAETRRSSEPR